MHALSNWAFAENTPPKGMIASHLRKCTIIDFKNICEIVDLAFDDVINDSLSSSQKNLHDCSLTFKIISVTKDCVEKKNTNFEESEFE